MAQKSFWQRIPRHWQEIGYCVLGVAFFLFVLFVGLTGAFNDTERALEVESNRTADVFTIEWEDGEPYEVDRFNNNSERTLTEFYLVARVKLQMNSIRFIFVDKPKNVNVEVKALSLPSAEKEGETFDFVLTSSALKRENEQVFALDTSVGIQRYTKVKITFSSAVVLDYVSVDFQGFVEETNAVS